MWPDWFFFQCQWVNLKELQRGVKSEGLLVRPSAVLSYGQLGLREALTAGAGGTRYAALQVTSYRWALYKWCLLHGINLLEFGCNVLHLGSGHFLTSAGGGIYILYSPFACMPFYIITFCWSRLAPYKLNQSCPLMAKSNCFFMVIDTMQSSHIVTMYASFYVSLMIPMKVNVSIMIELYFW